MTVPSSFVVICPRMKLEINQTSFGVLSQKSQLASRRLLDNVDVLHKVHSSHGDVCWYIWFGKRDS